MTSAMSPIGTPDSDAEARNRLALALDVPDLDEAVRWARNLAPWFGIAKVGLELFSAAGPAAITRLRDLDFAVFADLKLHDIPTTVERAARVLGRIGASYVNFHAAGGVAMLRGAVTGLTEGARDAGCRAPVALGVTVLTSDEDASAFAYRLRALVEAGCGGAVCSVHEVAAVKRARSDLIAVVPGVRLAGADPDDQRRLGTPADAIAAGADILVVGRTVTAAADPARAAQLVHAAVTGVSPG
jgi:orotidine-5'-phosphate decarboxylase